MTTSTHIARVKKAELLSPLGAGVLGAGIALLLPNQLAPYALPILLFGLISHAVGMSQKHGLGQQGEAIHVWWAEGLLLVVLAGLGRLVGSDYRPPVLNGTDGCAVTINLLLFKIVVRWATHQVFLVHQQVKDVG